MDLFSKLSALRILLIDDDELIRDSLSLFFEGEGCRLVALETAEQGMEALRRKDFDIIIADYILPDMDGLAFFKHVQPFHPQAVKVLISAYGSEAVVAEAKQAGIQNFIDKPFTSETLEACLYRVVEKKGASAS